MKKIVLFVIIVLILGLLVMITTIQNSKRIEEEKKYSQNIIIQEESKIDENIIKQNIIEEEKENVVKDEMVSKVEDDSQKYNNLNETEAINTRKESASNVKTNEKLKEETKTNITQENSKSELIIENQNTQDKKEEIIVDTPQDTNNQTKTEEYKRNDSMILKIKQTIENNATEDMKKYGYKIVIDSSIKNLTNQFTYSEIRVINNIKYSFGTIKIYAEDYIVNGNIIMTECYIL